MPRHLEAKSCLIQLKEAYQGQCLMLQYDSEISDDDEPRRNSTLAVAQLAVEEREQGNVAGTMKILSQDTDTGIRKCLDTSKDLEGLMEIHGAAGPQS